MVTLKALTFLWGIVIFGLCFSCKTQEAPPPAIPPSPPRVVKEKNPDAQVIFDRVEAETIEQISLYFILQVKNPRSTATSMDIRNWRLQINERESDDGAVLILDTNERRIAPSASVQFPLRLDLDMSKIALSGDGDFTEYRTELQANLVFTFDKGDTTEAPIKSEAVFPRIREPEFTIAAIAVSKAEQINTRFRVSLQIDNPNIFPLALSSLTYKLYGDGHFWADGKKNAILHVPANSSTETQIFFLINFIDISRNLLDQLVALKQVQYRLMGETAVLTNIEYLPQFRLDFDLSGNSGMTE
jgi:LEA14-like dessication related protein